MTIQINQSWTNSKHHYNSIHFNSNQDIISRHLNSKYDINSVHYQFNSLSIQYQINSIQLNIQNSKLKLKKINVLPKILGNTIEIRNIKLKMLHRAKYPRKTRKNKRKSTTEHVKR